MRKLIISSVGTVIHPSWEIICYSIIEGFVELTKGLQPGCEFGPPPLPHGRVASAMAAPWLPWRRSLLATPSTPTRHPLSGINISYSQHSPCGEGLQMGAMIFVEYLSADEGLDRCGENHSLQLAKDREIDKQALYSFQNIVFIYLLIFFVSRSLQTI